MCVSAAVGNLAWAGTVRRVVYWGRRRGRYGPTLGKFQMPLGAWPLSLGCREPWKDLEQERKCQT